MAQACGDMNASGCRLPTAKWRARCGCARRRPACVRRFRSWTAITGCCREHVRGGMVSSKEIGNAPPLSLPDIEQIDRALLRVHPSIALSKAVFLIESARALVVFKHMQRGPAGSARNGLVEKQRADSATLVRRIDIELIDMRLNHRNETNNAAIRAARAQRPSPFGEFSGEPGPNLLLGMGHF